jgi:large-conductance mechanosensitive channel
MSEFKENLKQFIVNNGIIGTTAGVCIALVTKELIQTFISDIFIPLIIILLTFIKIKSIIQILPVTSGLNITHFITQIITWLIMILATFFFITYFMNTMGIDKNIKKTDKVNINGI